jgi:hypothetical protein
MFDNLSEDRVQLYTCALDVFACCLHQNIYELSFSEDCRSDLHVRAQLTAQLNSQFFHHLPQTSVKPFPKLIVITLRLFFAQLPYIIKANCN